MIARWHVITEVIWEWVLDRSCPHNSNFDLSLWLWFGFMTDWLLFHIISHYRLEQSNALLPLHAHGAGGHLGGERPIRGQYPGHVICVDQSGVRNEDPWQLGHFTNASLDKSSTDLQINSFYVSLMMSGRVCSEFALSESDLLCWEIWDADQRSHLHSLESAFLFSIYSERKVTHFLIILNVTNNFRFFGSNRSPRSGNLHMSACGYSLLNN